jgi:hypothetical protein
MGVHDIDASFVHKTPDFPQIENPVTGRKIAVQSEAVETGNVSLDDFFFNGSLGEFDGGFSIRKGDGKPLPAECFAK